jgi:hypothetical protein
LAVAYHPDFAIQTAIDNGTGRESFLRVFYQSGYVRFFVVLIDLSGYPYAEIVA